MSRSSFLPLATAVAVVLSVLSLSCEGPAGPPGTGFGGLDDPSVMPAVVYTYPPMNSEGPYPDFYVNDCWSTPCNYYSLIQIRFNKFMDVTSVRRAVRLTSSSGGVRTDTNNVISVGGDMIMVTPVTDDGSATGVRYRVGERYTLSIDSAARDMNGNALAGGFSTWFVPEPSFRVISSWPADSTVDFSATGSMGIEFNSLVDTSIFGHVRLDPPGQFYSHVGYDGRTVTLYPVTTLLNSTTYTIIVDESAADVVGNRLQSEFRSRFTTTGFGVSYLYPQNGSPAVPLYQPVYVTCTGAMDTSTFRGAFSIEPATEGTIYINSRDDQAQFVPERGLRSLTRYTVRVDTSLRSMRGERLPETAVSVFETEQFRVTSTYPYEGSTGFPRSGVISVSTNGVLDITAIEGAVRIEPPVAFSVTLQYTSQFTIRPSQPLPPLTGYTLTIGTTLRTMAGDLLPAPYILHFSTAAN